MSGQVWVTSSLGGYLANPKLSKSLRQAASPNYVFRQFVRLEEAFGKKSSDKFLFDKLSRITTTGGTIAETSTMPEAGFTVTQDSCQISEYGNSIPYTQKLETLSEFDVNDISSTTLRDDQTDTLDRAVATVAKTAKFKAVCVSTSSTAFTTNGTATATSTANMSDKNVRDVIDYMKTKKIPKYGAGKDFVAAVSVNSQRGLYDYLQALMAYTTPEYMYNSEVGRYYDTRFVAENNVLSNALGTGSIFGEAIFFGGDSLLEAVATSEEIRMKVPSDYGRSKGVAWYYLGGFKKVWDYSTDTEEHIVHVTSA